MTLLKQRDTYQPFLYEPAYHYWLKQQQAHWLHTEIPMEGDVQDWKIKLTDVEKAVVGGVLKGFVQAEILVNDYWAHNVAQWFKHPEIGLMASCFGAMEGIHTVSYAQLNETLGLREYEAFLEEPSAKAKIDRLVDIDPDHTSVRDMARSLAIFSAFTEGVSLFSSFAVLLSFSLQDKLKGVGQIISFSIRDESLHSEAGCWLFRTLVQENPDIWDDELKKDIYDAARTTVILEDNFIDQLFSVGEIERVTPHDLKQFIRHRCNVKLGDLGLKANWDDIDEEALERMDWFDFLSVGVESQDFFAQRVSAYSKGNINFDNMW